MVLESYSASAIGLTNLDMLNPKIKVRRGDFWALVKALPFEQRRKFTSS